MNEAERIRRLRYQRRKMEAEDRERARLLGLDRAELDNEFLKQCGIAPVMFIEGRIVVWKKVKGLICTTTT